MLSEYQIYYYDNGEASAVYSPNGRQLIYNPTDKTFDESHSLTKELRSQEQKEGTELDLSDRLPQEPAIAVGITPESTITEMRSQRALLLTDLDKLAVGNNPNAIADLDLLYYRNNKPDDNEKGAYINKKGYMIFPSLKTLKEDEETISFIFYSGDDNNYLVFGYCAEETWNLNSNNYNHTELSLRFCNQQGRLYQHGLFASGRASQSELGSVDFDRDYYYRLDMPVGGEEAKLYCLENGDPQNWLKGTLKQVIPYSIAPDLIGETLFPYFGNYNRETSPLTGVFLR